MGVGVLPPGVALACPPLVALGGPPWPLPCATCASFASFGMLPARLFRRATLRLCAILLLTINIEMVVSLPTIVTCFFAFVFVDLDQPVSPFLLYDAAAQFS